MPYYVRRSDGTYRVHMSDGSDREPASEWAAYLRDITDRPGWSVARLARDSGLHRSTLFRWLEGNTGKTVTLRSVQLIAKAAGDDLQTALRAAGGVLQQTADEADDLDLEIRMIEKSDLPGDVKAAMIREAIRLRDRQLAERRAFVEKQEADRREQVRTWLNIAGGEPRTN